MRKFLRRAVYAAGVIVVLALAAFIWFNVTYPRVEPAPDIHIKATPAMIARGQYLVVHVAGCFDCHSERDWTRYSGPVIPGTQGKGGEIFDEVTAGVPGVLYARNITPAGIGGWTDGQIVRAITCGVDNKGRALFPMMPYDHFNKMSRYDIYSIVAYLRTIKPVVNNVPEGHLDFPMNYLVKTMPIPSYDPAPSPDTTDTVAYGKYLASAATCDECHTEMVNGQYVDSMEYAGGSEFDMSGGIVRSANLTPDSSTGIGKWTKAQFIAFFKSYDNPSSRDIPVSPKAFNTPMPMVSFSGITDYDLGAIYEFLRSLKPIRNKVVLFTPEK